MKTAFIILGTLLANVQHDVHGLCNNCKKASRTGNPPRNNNLAGIIDRNECAIKFENITAVATGIAEGSIECKKLHSKAVKCLRGTHGSHNASLSTVSNDVRSRERSSRITSEDRGLCNICPKTEVFDNQNKEITTIGHENHTVIDDRTIIAKDVNGGSDECKAIQEKAAECFCSTKSSVRIEESKIERRTIDIQRVLQNEEIQPTASDAPSDSGTESTYPSTSPSTSSASPSGSVYPSGTPSESGTESAYPSTSPSRSSVSPSGSVYPSDAPSDNGTESAYPSTSPSRSSAKPSGSVYPSDTPSESVTESAYPSTSPSRSPNIELSNMPSLVPSGYSSDEPSFGPTGFPSSRSISVPSSAPTSSPTASPTTLSPTASPTLAPTAIPTASPTDSPTETPTASPTDSPTSAPTSSPTASPTTLSPTASQFDLEGNRVYVGCDAIIFLMNIDCDISNEGNSDQCQFTFVAIGESVIDGDDFNFNPYPSYGQDINDINSDEVCVASGLTTIPILDRIEGNNIPPIPLQNSRGCGEIADNMFVVKGEITSDGSGNIKLSYSQDFGVSYYTDEYTESSLYLALSVDNFDVDSRRLQQHSEVSVLIETLNEVTEDPAGFTFPPCRKNDFSVEPSLAPSDEPSKAPPLSQATFDVALHLGTSRNVSEVLNEIKDIAAEEFRMDINVSPNIDTRRSLLRGDRSLQAQSTCEIQVSAEESVCEFSVTNDACSNEGCLSFVATVQEPQGDSEGCEVNSMMDNMMRMMTQGTFMTDVFCEVGSNANVQYATAAPSLQPSVEPSISLVPTTEFNCIDDPNFRIKIGKRKNKKYVDGCDFVRRNPDSRVCRSGRKAREFRRRCPNSCNEPRCTCKDKKKVVFYVGKEKFKSTCKRIRRSLCDKVPKVKNRCPIRCRIPQCVGSL